MTDKIKMPLLYLQSKDPSRRDYMAPQHTRQRPRKQKAGSRKAKSRKQESRKQRARSSKQQARSSKHQPRSCKCKEMMQAQRKSSRNYESREIVNSFTSFTFAACRHIQLYIDPTSKLSTPAASLECTLNPKPPSPYFKAPPFPLSSSVSSTT